MTKLIRVAIAMGGLWMIGVFAVVGIEFLSILPGECVMNGKDMSHFISVKLFFFSCNIFTDIPTQWWGASVFHWDNQIIEFNTRRFVFLLVGPIAISWLFGAAGLTTWRWIAKGK